MVSSQTEKIRPSDIRLETEPRYDVKQDDLDLLETAMLEYVDSIVKTPTSVALWVSADHPFANFVRTHEARYFPEVTEVSPEDDESTIFLTVVDTRPDVRRVVHSATVMRSLLNEEELSESSRTGFYTVDSLIERGNFSLQDFMDYYNEKNVDLSRAVSVETNFRIGDKPPDFNGLKSSDVAYVAIFELAVGDAGATDRGRAAVFATINSSQARSFERIGLETDKLMGRSVDEFTTEESELGVESAPIAILYTKACDELFAELKQFMPSIKVERR